MRIEDVVMRRTDLSTFLVHLTRDGDKEGDTAKERLKTILKEMAIGAKNPFGPAVSTLQQKNMSTTSQNCVCFTETPLEYVHLLAGPIEDRQCNFKPYGIAITKKQGRRKGVNPIWYLDITPGHDWLTKPLEAMIKFAISSCEKSKADFSGHGLSRLTPFIEQMGSGQKASGVGGYKKEFWWEREWRHCGDFPLPRKLIVLCPIAEHAEMRQVVEGIDPSKRYIEPAYVDPSWGLEKIIGKLAGFDMEDLGPF
jgi:hypothetical protein